MEAFYENGTACDHFKCNITYHKASQEFREWIRQEIRIVNHKYEEFVYVRNWEGFTAGGEKALDPETVVGMVQTSPDKMPFVKRLLEHWDGPLSLSVIIPHPHGSAEAVRCREVLLSYTENVMRPRQHQSFAMAFLYANAHSATLHCRLTEASTGLEPGALDESAFDGAFKSDQFYTEVWDEEYPINTLRNVAMRMVQTNAAVLMLDADFVPSATMYSNLVGRGGSHPVLELREKWARRERQVIVMAAFERLARREHEPPEPSCPEGSGCWVYRDVDVPLNKQVLSRMVRRGTAEPFYWSRWKTGHKCWLPDKWLTTGKSYKVPYTPSCEPYVVGLRDALPAYDERFRGKARDKVSYLATVAAIGTTFVVQSNDFIIHLPHNSSVWLLDHATWTAHWKATTLVLPLVLYDLVLDDVAALVAAGHADFTQQLTAELSKLSQRA